MSCTYMSLSVQLQDSTHNTLSYLYIYGDNMYIHVNKIDFSTRL